MTCKLPTPKFAILMERPVRGEFDGYTEKGLRAAIALSTKDGEIAKLNRELKRRGLPTEPSPVAIEALDLTKAVPDELIAPLAHPMPEFEKKPRKRKRVTRLLWNPKVHQ